MMHRYIAMISTSADEVGFSSICDRLIPKEADWTQTLETRQVKVWTYRRRPSRLGSRALGSAGCLIGLDHDVNGGSPRHWTLGLDDVGVLADQHHGSYVAILDNDSKGEVSLYRDPTGRLDCWRIRTEAADVFFSHLGDVIALKAHFGALNWDFLLHHLDNTWVHGRETGLTGVTEVLPGESLIYRDGRLEHRMAWSPDHFARQRHETLDQARAEIRLAAEASILPVATSYSAMALDLSGGLDSSIVLGLLRRHTTADKIVGVNFITDHPESDERGYARDAAAFHAIRIIEQPMQAAQNTIGDSFAGRLLRPASRIIATVYDKIAGDIYRTLGSEAFVTGNGGDHLFYEGLGVDALSDYWRQKGFGRGFVATAVQLAQLSNRTVWSAFGATLADIVHGSDPWRVLPRANNAFLSDKCHARDNGWRHVHPWIESALDLAAPAKLRQIFNLIELQNHYARYGRADVAEEVHPLFSQRLMEASLRTPAYWFQADGVQRGFARRVFADLLPVSVRQRRAKSGNTSLWLQVITQELPRVTEMLMEGQLASRGYLLRDKVATALKDLGGIGAKRPPRHLMDCLTTEMWIQQAAA